MKNGRPLATVSLYFFFWRFIYLCTYSVGPVFMSVCYGRDALALSTSDWPSAEWLTGRNQTADLNFDQPLVFLLGVRHTAAVFSSLTTLSCDDRYKSIDTLTESSPTFLNKFCQRSPTTRSICVVEIQSIRLNHVHSGDKIDNFDNA